jgi:hypothetical protein
MRRVRVEARGGVDKVRDPPGLVGPGLLVTHRRARTLRRDAGSTGLEVSPGGTSSSGCESVSSSTKAAEKTRAGMAISSRCRRRKPIRPNRPRHGGIGPGIGSGRGGAALNILRGGPCPRGAPSVPLFSASFSCKRARSKESYGPDEG